MPGSPEPVPMAASSRLMSRVPKLGFDKLSPNGRTNPFVLRLSKDLLVHEALRRMREESVQLVVVEAEERAIGVVTLTDVVKRVLPGEATVGAAG